MVKIKAGYVMNPREKAEYDRMNALPRKAAGSVAYYFKPQTKYPPRIYLFMHAELWCDRNRRPMGLFHAFPFLTRPMNREEIEYHHFDTRLCYHQYEDWGKLLYAEEKEAGQLDMEQPGAGAAFYQKLRSFQKQYPLGSMAETAAPTPPLSESGEMREIRKLIQDIGKFTVAEIAEMLDREQRGTKRPAVLIVLREMYKHVAGVPNHVDSLTPEIIARKAELSRQRSRRNFVRRVYRQNPMFAIDEIRKRYPDYAFNDLMKDLKRKKAVPKRAKKRKPVLDLRRVQLQKLAAKLRYMNADDVDYHHTCTRMAILEQAHRLHCPIPVPVRLQGKTEVYYFHWKTRETVVKAFAELANTEGQTHEALKEKHKEIASGNYSF